MTARDYFTHDLKCPSCGRTGVAEASQADGWSYMRDDSTSVESMPVGFRDVRKDRAKRPVYECIACGVVVKE